eukprot:Sdes_comp15005_c0_seq1m3765
MVRWGLCHAMDSTMNMKKSCFGKTISAIQKLHPLIFFFCSSFLHFFIHFMSGLTGLKKSYRILIRRCCKLQDEQKRNYILQEIRTAFRSPNMTSMQLEAWAREKIEFLSILSPSLPQNPGKTTYQIQNGIVSSVSSASSPNSSKRVLTGYENQGSVDPAAVRKHWSLFRKQMKLGL